MKNIKSAICRRKKLCVSICIIFMLLITLVIANESTKRGYFYPVNESGSHIEYFAFHDKGYCEADVARGKAQSAAGTLMINEYSAENCPDSYKRYGNVIVINKGEWIGVHLGPWMLLWTVHYKEGVYENDRRFWLLKYYGKTLQPYNIKSSTGPYDIQKLP